MRPIKLKLSGLNSYVDNQVIDFEKLTERGLFGIFGPTGSGKSTILDAITMAMYGNIPRNTKEYINSASDKANISYEFEIGSKDFKRRYIVDRTIKRTKTGGILTSHCRLVEIHNDEQSTVLADKATEVNKKISEVVGLTADDFTRSVVLPQGKFNDFLKLTGSERRNMLERIFGLEKYGRMLIDKVRQRKSEENKNLLILNTKLGGYEGISEEEYKNVLNELKELNLSESKYKEELKDIELKFEKCKDIYEKQLELEKYELEKKEIDLKSKEIEDKENKLEDAYKAEKIKPYIENISSLEKSIDKDKCIVKDIDNILNIEKQELILIQKQYEEIKNKKDTELPRLSEKKVKLERAIELESQVEELDKELLILRADYKKLIIEKESLDKSKTELNSSKLSIERYINELETKSKDLRISADLKQKVFLAYDTEKEYEVLDTQIKKSIEKRDILKKELSEKEFDFRRTKKHKDDINKDLEEAIKKQETINNKCPGDNDNIIKNNESLAILRNKIEILKDYKDRKKIVKDELNTIEEQKFKVEREINSIENKLERKSKEIEDLEKELNNLRYINLANELRKELKENTPCPVCGSTHHVKFDLTNTSSQVEYTSSKLENYKLEEKSLKSNLDKYNIKNSSIKSAYQIKEKELKELNLKIGNDNVDELSRKYDEEKRKLDSLKVNVELWRKDKEDIDKKVVQLKENKYEIEKEYIKLDEYIQSTKKALENINKDIDEIENKHNVTKDKYLNLKSILKINDIKSKVNEINNNEKILEDVDKKLDQKQKEKSESIEKLELIQKQIHEKDLESSRLKDLGQEKKKIRDEKYNELITTTKGKSAKIILEDVEVTINDIINQESSLNLKKDDKLKSIEEHLAQKNNIEGSLKNSKEQYENQQMILNNLLKEYKFESIYAVKRCILDEKYINKLKDEISDYKEKSSRIKSKIKDLKGKIGKDYVTKESYDELKQSISDIKIKIENINSNKGAKKLHANNLKEALDKIEDINKEFKKVQHKVDLLEDLDKVIQGNKLVEYVSTSQLKYIAIEASKRLKDITKGRYALEIDSTLNFVMRDDFNGGIRRSVDTLSGGETFLTSLSLALALSSQIQLKGSAPLEFFFLDEGFGSLDSELLEIVMNSLERLHSDRLSVGIISHVEELKNRVPVKLIVSPSEAGNGSKVKIEYS